MRIFLFILTFSLLAQNFSYAQRIDLRPKKQYQEGSETEKSDKYLFGDIFKESFKGYAFYSFVNSKQAFTGNFKIVPSVFKRLKLPIELEFVRENKLCSKVIFDNALFNLEIVEGVKYEVATGIESAETGKMTFTVSKNEKGRFTIKGELALNDYSPTQAPLLTYRFEVNQVYGDEILPIPEYPLAETYSDIFSRYFVGESNSNGVISKLNIKPVTKDGREIIFALSDRRPFIIFLSSEILKTKIENGISQRHIDYLDGGILNNDLSFVVSRISDDKYTMSGTLKNIYGEFNFNGEFLSASEKYEELVNERKMKIKRDAFRKTKKKITDLFSRLMGEDNGDRIPLEDVDPAIKSYIESNQNRIIKDISDEGISEYKIEKINNIALVMNDNEMVYNHDPATAVLIYGQKLDEIQVFSNGPIIIMDSEINTLLLSKSWISINKSSKVYGIVTGIPTLVESYPVMRRLIYFEGVKLLTNFSSSNSEEN